MVTKIAIIGMGYVGLPLALLASRKGFDVTGIEIDEKKLAKLQSGFSPIDDVADDEVKNSKITFTPDFDLLRECGIGVICVPTPVDHEKNPDLSLLKKATLATSEHMSDGSLIIVESTVNPGVCDEVLIPLIESETNHRVGETLHIAHCPERINPGDPKWHVGNINRVLGASSKKGLNDAFDFYSKIIDGEIMKMANLKEAEAVKIVENSFRDINIAFVNELARSFNVLGINIHNVIDGAATKPFAFMPHYPGIGVGGHCIPVDPYYLIEYANDHGFDHKFLKLARQINESMPSYCVDNLERFYSRKGESLKQKRVLVLGLSYKANIGDSRESPSKNVVKALEDKGAIVKKFDPFFLDQSDYKNLNDAISDTQAAILVTAHKEFVEIEPGSMPSGYVLFDGRDAFLSKKDAFTAAGIEYASISDVSM